MVAMILMIIMTIYNDAGSFLAVKAGGSHILELLRVWGVGAFCWCC